MSFKVIVIPWATVFCSCGDVFAVAGRKDEFHPGLDTPGETWTCGNKECNITYSNIDILRKLGKNGVAAFGNPFADRPPTKSFANEITA